MATVTWPLDRAFLPASLSFGSSTMKSSYVGLLSGERETVSHLSDRITCTLTLGPVKGLSDAGRRSAFLAALDSSGDWVSFGPLQRRRPAGNMGGGAVTVNGAVAAAAKTIVLAGVLSAPNLLLYHGFELDGNADGLADGWSTATNGTTGSVTPTRGAFTGYLGTNAQRLTISGLGTTSGDSVALIATNYAAVVAGLSYTLSVTQAVDNACQGALRVDWYDSTPTFLSSTFTTVVPSTSGMTRQSATFTSPASATKAIARASVSQRSGSTGGVIWTLDGMQLELGAAASAYSGAVAAAPGDFFAVGGNLFQVGPAGATGTDAGAISVPLALPVQKAISNGAAAVMESPTGTWQLDTDGISLDYSPAAIQHGIALPFRQLIV